MMIIAKMIGYMLTWTTYGSWLPGDDRGYVKDGVILPPAKRLENVSRHLMKYETMFFEKRDCEIVRKSILTEADVIGQRIYAVAVEKTHVHLVAGNTEMAIGRVVSHYKNAARLNLRKAGMDGKIWTKGFDKRYCLDESQMQSRIEYVQDHNIAKPSR